MIPLVLAVVSMFPQSPAERQMNRNAMILEAPNTRTIEKGDQSNIDDARRVLVRTDAEWSTLWRQHHPDKPRPAVDFSRPTAR